MSIIIIIAGLMISFSGYFVKESRLTLIEDAKAYGNGTDYFDHDLAQAQKIINISNVLIVVGIIVVIVGIALTVRNMLHRNDPAKQDNSPDKKLICFKCGMAISRTQRTCLKCNNDLVMQRKLYKRNLIQCPSCGNLVTAGAENCPSCGGEMIKI